MDITKEIATRAVVAVLLKGWIPYRGPRGGEGWQNTDDPEDVRYQDDPPGDVPEEYEDMAEDWGTDDAESETPEIETVTVEPDEYNQSINEFVEADPEKGAFLTVHSPEELADHTLLMTEDRGAGVAVSPEGDVQNLFNHTGPEDAGDELIQKAIAAGGRTLDCYDGYLRRLYTKHGFREVGRMEFVREFAPDDWNYEKYGEPDVVFMAYAPDELSTEISNQYYETDEWTDAKQESRRAANFERDERRKGRRVGRRERRANSPAGGTGRQALSRKQEIAAEISRAVTESVGDPNGRRDD